ncbi:MAG: ABC transporter ATP-binding protein [Lachnospiraceae bacterium]|nr:ABC transporter ATP-binding protein [Lachnospiraceae bacterium]
MKKLLIYLRDYRKESFLGPLFKLLEASFELIVPLVVAAIIDKGIAFSDRGYIVRMSLVLVLLGLVGLACSVTAQYFAARASTGFVSRVRHELFSHIQFFRYETLDEIGISTLITRMTSDMNQVQTGLNLALRLLLRSPFVVFGAMIMAFTIDTRAALHFAAVIPLLSAVVFGIMLVNIPLYKKVQGLLDRVLGSTRENLTGVRVLRAFGREHSEIASFEERNNALTDMQKHVGRISALMNPVTYVIINLAILMLIRTGALRVEAGILTQGAVVALYNYMSQILVELIKLANLIINITKSISCGNRIQSILEIPAPDGAQSGAANADAGVPSPLDAGSAVQDRVAKAADSPDGMEAPCHVSFEHAGIRYPGAGEESLSDVTLHIRRGETVGVIGGTGSGKSTLVNLIPRFYDVTEGRVLVEGKDVRSMDVSELRKKIGIVPQKAQLFSGTIRDNLRWGREDASDEEILEAAECAQALDVIKAKGGLDGRIEQAGRNLSGGQKQRLTIARALVRRPEILILDDSSSALDFATDAALRSALRSLPFRPTVFIVSQRTSSIRHADQIIVLDDGRCVGCGTHDELLAGCGVYREIFDSQFRKEDRGA